MTTGYGSLTSSGTFSIRTANAGTTGVSGGLSFKTGASNNGNSGHILVGTGEANNGVGGSISMVVGGATWASAANANDYGGTVHIQAGDAGNAGNPPGNVEVYAGAGSTNGYIQIYLATHTDLKLKDDEESYLKAAGSLEIKGIVTDASTQVGKITIGASGEMTMTSTAKVEVESAYAGANAIKFSSTDAAGSVQVQNAPLVVNAGIGIGANAGVSTAGPLINFMASGLMDWYTSYATSSTIVLATKEYIQARQALPRLGSTYNAVSGTTPQYTGGGAWSDYAMFKVMVTPPTRVSIQTGSAGSGYCAPSNAGDPTYGSVSNVAMTATECPLVWTAWAEVFTVGTAELHVYIRLINTKASSHTLTIDSGEAWKWPFFVLGHRCHGSDAYTCQTAI